MSRSFHRAAIAGLVLAFIVVVLGAWVRLSDAGLGCPDWPGCYGSMVVPLEAGEGPASTIRPLHHGKAWKEMIHRYAAGVLGLLILGLAVTAWRSRRAPDQPVGVPLVLLALVIFQAVLGMWTVTWLLKPVIVVAHLLGGFAVLALLGWLVAAPVAGGEDRRLARWAVAGIIVLGVQVFLGGWTSANYAALVCPEFPACRAGEYFPPADFREGFTLWRGIGTDYEGGVLDAPARTAIHLAHRGGALVTVLVLGCIAVLCLRGARPATRRIGAALGIALLLQVGLGIANVLLRLPIVLAVSHNGVAALLLLGLIVLLRHTTPEFRVQFT